jgi:hypothetical protein
MDNHNSEDFDQLKFDKQRRAALSKLADFSTPQYSIDTFLDDLAIYFGPDVDLNMEKIRSTLAKPGLFTWLIAQAKEEHLHPVIIFVRKLFLDVGRSGNEKWPDELLRGEFTLD